MSPSLLEGVLDGFSKERIDTNNIPKSQEQHKRAASEWAPLWKLILEKFEGIKSLDDTNKKRLHNTLCRSFSKFTRCDGIKEFEYKLYFQTYRTDNSKNNKGLSRTFRLDL